MAQGHRAQPEHFSQCYRKTLWPHATCTGSISGKSPTVLRSREDTGGPSVYSPASKRPAPLPLSQALHQRAALRSERLRGQWLSVCDPTPAAAAPGNLLECKFPGSVPHPLNPEIESLEVGPCNLGCHKPSGECCSTFTFETHWSSQQF